MCGSDLCFLVFSATQRLGLLQEKHRVLGILLEFITVFKTLEELMLQAL